MKKIALTAFAIITLMGMCILTSCSLLTVQSSANSASAETSFEPTETAAVATPTPTPATLETVVTLPVPATYASLYDGLKLYSDGSRSVVLKTLAKGDQVIITGTAGQYGVTADGAYINLHLMSVVIPATPPAVEPTTVPTATPTPKPTSVPKPTLTPKPTPTPKPTATPAPTAVPVATLSTSEVESLVWTQVESARSGFTTNHSDVLSAKCRSNAARFIICHNIPNGSLESAGAIGQLSNGGWRWGNNNDFATLEECVASLGNYLVTQHVPLMATTADYTEFGVGVAKFEQTGYVTEYYVYISCATPDELAYQISTGWYD